MTTPRATRLLRVADLRQVRDTIAGLLSDDDPLAARDCLVVVPTRAAAAFLRRALEDRLLTVRSALVLPDLVTRDELTPRLAERLPNRPRVFTAAEREVMMAAACRHAEEMGADPPFLVRPGLIAYILDLYDSLRRQQKDVAAFERLVLETLEPNAAIDRGAEQLVRQTRFLVAAFREFERQCAATDGVDEHGLREQLLRSAVARPWTRAIVAVRDVAATSFGLWASDFDLLTRLPGLERIDVVATESALAGGLDERLHTMLPGMEVICVPAPGPQRALLHQTSAAEGPVHSSRDREEEVMAFARWAKSTAREAGRRGVSSGLDRLALVVRRPLPYVYLAREILRSGGVHCQMFDTLPLAGEPYAAAVDLVCSFVTSNSSRASTIELLRSPHFNLAGSADRGGDEAGEWRRDVAALDRSLNEAGYLGGREALERLVESWLDDARQRRAAAAGAVALRLADELSPLSEPQAGWVHLGVLGEFLREHDTLPPVLPPVSPSLLPAVEEPLHARHLRARPAVTSVLAALADAYARHDDRPIAFADLAAIVRARVEQQTFSPRGPAAGVHVADAESAAFGDFDAVWLAGLVDGEWPQRPRRSIFYSTGLLRQLGWPAEADRIQGERSLFRDLMRLPARELVASGFALEDDALVSASPFVEELAAAAIETVDRPALSVIRVFDHEALALDPPRPDALAEPAATWARMRLDRANTRDPRPDTRDPTPDTRAYSLSALERYQDCPFKFFAADVLRLEEPAEDRSTLTPRRRGLFIHEVLQRCFEDWDSHGGGAITPERIDDARARFVAVAEGLLGRLSESEAGLERPRLVGSPIAVGMIDVVLEMEASRSEAVTGRLLEYSFEGEFSLGSSDGRRARLRGVIDRVDLLPGRRLRVIDYKSGAAPNVKRALQVPAYALGAAERLEERDRAPWTVDEAAYIALAGKRRLVSVVKPGAADARATLDAARERVFAVLDGIGRSEFPPRPNDVFMCTYCAFSSVCRKDYVDELE